MRVRSEYFPSKTFGTWVVFGVDQNEHEATTVGGSFLTTHIIHHHHYYQLSSWSIVAAALATRARRFRLRQQIIILRSCCFEWRTDVYCMFAIIITTLNIRLPHTTTTKINHFIESMNEDSPHTLGSFFFLSGNSTVL